MEQETTQQAERRVSRDRYFMNFAITAALASKCHKAQYGAVIIDRNERVVATGYNGKPAGSCNDDICFREPPVAREDYAHCCNHAEHNAISYCDRHDRENGTIYVNGLPCRPCSIDIMSSGITRIVYLSANSFNGHVGQTDPSDEFWDSYGLKIKRFAMEPPTNGILYSRDEILNYAHYTW